MFPKADYEVSRQCSHATPPRRTVRDRRVGGMVDGIAAGNLLNKDTIRFDSFIQSNSLLCVP